MVQPILKTKFYKGLWECKFQRKKTVSYNWEMIVKLVKIYVFDV